MTLSPLNGTFFVVRGPLCCCPFIGRAEQSKAKAAVTSITECKKNNIRWPVEISASNGVDLARASQSAKRGKKKIGIIPFVYHFNRHFGQYFPNDPNQTLANK